ncbi:MAG: alkene reductase [Alphaproteobacteria bacterium]|nr:alkene reductase [Alphaproteobacteria bacterium SS10]
MTNTNHAALFEPLKLGGIDVLNRVLMAPLTRNRAHPDGTPAEMAIEYYRQRAGAGLIFTEATQVSAMGKGYINTPGIYTDGHAAAWKKITDAVHEAGGKIAIQLWHVGRISHSSLLPNNAKPYAPSAIAAKSQTFIETGMVDVSEPQAITVEEIKATVAEYRHAAELAKQAGFDAIEIHSANGYLIDQFIRDGSNKRTDEYGGPIENRIRFLKEVTEAVLEVWPADKVGFRLSPTGGFNDMSDSDPAATFSAVAKAMNAYGLAFLHMVEEFPGEESSAEDQAVNKAVREAWTGAYIANGGFDAAKADAAVASGAADAVAFGRPFISNPDLPKRIAKGASLTEPDQTTFYGGDGKCYTDYPTLEQEAAA